MLHSLEVTFLFAVMEYAIHMTFFSLPLLLSPSLSPPPTPQSKLFFRRWFEVVDLVVILVTTLITILYVILDEHGEEDSETGNIIIS